MLGGDNDARWAKVLLVQDRRARVVQCGLMKGALRYLFRDVFGREGDQCGATSWGGDLKDVNGGGYLCGVARVPPGLFPGLRYDLFSLLNFFDCCHANDTVAFGRRAATVIFGVEIRVEG